MMFPVLSKMKIGRQRKDILRPSRHFLVAKIYLFLLCGLLYFPLAGLPARAGSGGADQSLLNKGWLRGQWTHFTTENGLSSNVVLSIAVQGENVWFGTFAGGASYLQKASGQWSAYTTKGGKALAKKMHSSLTWENALEDNHVTAIAVDPDDGVWFGTTFYGFGDLFGVSRWGGSPTPRWTTYGLAQGLVCNDITSLAIDRDSVWAGTQKGLGRYIKKTGAWRFYGSSKQIPGKYVNVVLSRGQEVWLGTSLGIVILDKKEGTWKSFQSKDGLPEDTIQALAFDGVNIWAGGTYGSLALYSEREGRWSTVHTNDGLEGKWIKAMATDGTFLWVARDGGVSCLDIPGGQWLALTSADGLIDSLVNAVAIDGPAVWFGTGAGVSRLLLKRKP
jgi:ligand-binding sensor domain-containing protein